VHNKGIIKTVNITWNAIQKQRRYNLYGSPCHSDITIHVLRLISTIPVLSRYRFVRMKIKKYHCQNISKICSNCCSYNLFLLSSFIYLLHDFQYNSNTTGATCETGTAYRSGASEYTPSYCSIFSFSVVFCRSLLDL
jgi:hypothetical protein